MAEFLEKMKADETSRASGAGKNEVFDNEAPHNDESNGGAKFTLDDINAELDNLMSSGKSEASSVKMEENATEVVNVPMEAVSEAGREDGRLKDGTVIKIR